MVDIVLHVKGMSCDHCVKAVEEALGSLPGVERALVDLAEGEVHVRYDADIVDPIRMKAAVEEAGYETE
ncbi:copper ion binding protein [Ammoniphilus sp. CFH 90114]|uniref:copper ion binding protein n=1 Tax=Ammoniphilus sp. CFH 90114 TaxID=2493665 RepID=UPI00100DD6B2|nr:copper ion binding protein [Ammoniphilus sp. CFH 90114]RXT15279.1 copper chaperone [Ammoniphilus sp. CFH 90114]